MSQSISGFSDRRRIVLPITILQATPSMEVFGIEAVALLDTGSTTSGITPRRARELDLPKRGKKPIGSAQGEGQAERYLFRIGLSRAAQHGEIVLPFIFDDVVGFELAENFSIDALLGMAIISQCDFRMDRNGRWSLAFG